MILKIFSLIAVFLCIWCFMVKPGGRHEKISVFKKYRYAHRGLHDICHGIPENSLTAFRLAAKKGYGAEFDVHLTADGKLMVMHDSSLERMCGVSGTIEELTSQELEKYQLANTEEKIPYMADVLKIFEDKAPIIIELKTRLGNPAALTKAVCRELEGYKGTYCIESFDFRVLRWLRKNQPEIMRGQLASFSNRDAKKIPYLLDFCARNMLTNFMTKPNFTAYKYADRHAITMSACRIVWKVQEVSWTIRTPEQLAEVEKEGAIAIFEQFEP